MYIPRQHDLLNRKTAVITNAIAEGSHPVLSITYFIPDEHKAGGRYATIKARIKRIDPTSRILFLITLDDPELPESISLDRILSIDGELVDHIDD